ncbi:hypothetical protein [uncultured Clostridium sp.]|jgi:hypothetical protein|uniref:hypothetical protein n=1 Tax=uncultured Clostridium sp. TaxID=59620 RepID=UPI0026337A2E|nr:hypothetical protein [uncultured Clostridium sp.]
MTSYSAESCESKIKEYKKFLKEEKFNNIEIVYTKVPKITDGYIYKRRKMLTESPIELRCNDELIMDLSVREIQGTKESIRKAHGQCGVLGLGLGFYVQEIAKKEEVSEVIVYEINRDVIDLYNKNFPSNSKVKIIEGNGFKAERKQFDFFFADIYSYKISEDIAYDYEKLIELHDIEEYSFFGVEKFLLSCPMEELMSVYMPDEWMEMTKKCFDNVDKLGQVKNIKKLRRNEALKVLKELERILNN